MTPNQKFDADVLVAHRGFLHALAQRLVDEHTAEDLVQETYLRVLQRLPSSLGSPRDLLAQVVRNFARKTSGREATRSRRERRAARPEGMEEERASQEFELLHHLATALRGLPQPYKTAVYRSGGFSVLQGRLTLEGGSFPGMTASLRRGGLESLFDGE